MSNIIFRKAETKDAQAILDYLDVIGKESDNLTFGEEGIGYSLEEEIAMIESLETNPNAIMFLAMDKDKVVSIGNLSASKRERSKHFSVLGISVLKAYWNKGIGKKMMLHLIDFAKQAPDTDLIHLEVRHDNAAAIHLYESCGFEKLCLIPKKMRINGIDHATYLMLLDLTK